MALDRKLLDILCCPVTHAPLEPAAASLLHMLNLQIQAGRIRNRRGEQLHRPWQQALVTGDGRLAYPVHDDVPILLEDDAVMLSQLDQLK